MANEIEASVQAAFDDKDITRATATLIRFGKVAPKNLRPAMVVMTDLAAKTGSVDSAAALLAKALADPAKAAGKLARTGVVLTLAQQAQLKSMTTLNGAEQKHYKALLKTNKGAAERYKSAKVAGKQTAAQTWLLQQLAKTTKGAASAMNGPMKDAQETLKDVTEDGQRALAEGFLPVLKRVQTGLSKALADPATLAKIRGFGQNVAGALDKVVSWAEGVNWTKIGDGLKTVADWGGKAIGAFSKMPPEAMAALLALGGLNKVSGGAITSLVGELGKGLIKGVLGMTAGVVNLKAGVVNGGGAGTGVTPVGTGGKSKLGTGLEILSKIAIVGLAAEAAVQLKPILDDFGGQIREALGAKPITAAQMPTSELSWPWGPKNTPTIMADLFGGNGLLGGTAATPAIDKQTALLADTHSEQIATTQGIATVAGKQAESLVAFRAGERTTQAAGVATAVASRIAGVTAALATTASAGRITGAIAANRPIVTTNVTVNVTAASVTKSVSVANRYGSQPSRSENAKGGP
jgi:hypothetical protein